MSNSIRIDDEGAFVINDKPLDVAGLNEKVIETIKTSEDASKLMVKTVKETKMKLEENLVKTDNIIQERVVKVTNEKIEKVVSETNAKVAKLVSDTDTKIIQANKESEILIKEKVDRVTDAKIGLIRIESAESMRAAVAANDAKMKQATEEAARSMDKIASDTENIITATLDSTMDTLDKMARESQDSMEAAGAAMDLKIDTLTEQFGKDMEVNLEQYDDKLAVVDKSIDNLKDAVGGIDELDEKIAKITDLNLDQKLETITYMVSDIDEVSKKIVSNDATLAVHSEGMKEMQAMTIQFKEDSVKLATFQEDTFKQLAQHTTSLANFGDNVLEQDQKLSKFDKKIEDQYITLSAVDAKFTEKFIINDDVVKKVDDTLNAHKTELRRTFETIITVDQQATTRIEHTNRDINALREMGNDLNEVLEATTATADNAVKSLTETNALLSKTNEELNITKSSLVVTEKIVTDAGLIFQDVQKELDKTIIDLSSATNEIDVLSAGIASQASNAAKQTEKLTAQDESIRVLTHDISEHKEMIETTNTNLDSAVKVSIAIESKIVTVKDDLGVVKNNLDIAKAKFSSDLERSVKEFDNSLAKTAGELTNNMKTDGAIIMDKMQEGMVAIDDLGKSLKTTDMIAAANREESDKLAKEVSEQQTTVFNLVADVQNHEVQIQDTTTSLNNTIGKLSETDTHIEQAKKEIADVSANVSVVKSDLDKDMNDAKNIFMDNLSNVRAELLGSLKSAEEMFGANVGKMKDDMEKSITDVKSLATGGASTATNDAKALVETLRAEMEAAVADAIKKADVALGDANVRMESKMVDMGISVTDTITRGLAEAALDNEKHLEENTEAIDIKIEDGVAELIRVKEDINNKMRDVTTILDDTKYALDAEIEKGKKLNVTVGEHSDIFSGYEDVIKKVNEKLAAVEESIGGIDELDDKIATIEDLDLDTKLAAIAEAVEDIETVTEQIKNNKANLQVVQDNIDKNNDYLNATNRSFDDVKAKFKDAVSRISEQDKDIDNIAGRVVANNKNISASNANISRSSATISSSNSIISKSNALIIKSNSNIGTVTKLIASIQNTIKNLNSDISSINSKISASNTNIGKSNNNISKNNANIVDNNKRISSLLSSNTAIESKINHNRIAMLDHSKLINANTANISGSNTNIATVKKSIKAIDSKINTTVKTITSAAAAAGTSERNAAGSYGAGVNTLLKINGIERNINSKSEDIDKKYMNISAANTNIDSKWKDINNKYIAVKAIDNKAKDINTKLGSAVKNMNNKASYINSKYSSIQSMDKRVTKLFGDTIRYAGIVADNVNVVKKLEVKVESSTKQAQAYSRTASDNASSSSRNASSARTYGLLSRDYSANARSTYNKIVTVHSQIAPIEGKINSIGKKITNIDSKINSSNKKLDSTLKTITTINNSVAGNKAAIDKVAVAANAHTAKINTSNKKIDSSNRLISASTTNITKNNSKIDSSNRNIGSSNQKIDAVNRNIGTVSKKIDASNKKIDSYIKSANDIEKSLNAKLDKTAKASDSIVKDLAGKVADIMTKAEFDALRLMRSRLYAGSGFITKGGVNDGRDWYIAGIRGGSRHYKTRNNLWMGQSFRDDGGTVYERSLRTNVSVNINGVTHNISQDNSNNTNLVFPDFNMPKIVKKSTTIPALTEGDNIIMDNRGYNLLQKHKTADEMLKYWQKPRGYHEKVNNNTVRIKPKGGDGLIMDYGNTNGPFVTMFKDIMYEATIVVTKIKGTCTLYPSWDNGKIKITKPGTYKHRFKNRYRTGVQRFHIYISGGSSNYLEFRTDSLKVEMLEPVALISLVDVSANTSINKLYNKFNVHTNITRTDLYFIESWEEQVSHRKDTLVSNFGNVRAGRGIEGVKHSTTRHASGQESNYSSFGFWEKNPYQGYGYVWDTLSIEDRNKIASDPDNNIYVDNGKVFQRKYRNRIVKGLGDNWESLRMTTRESRIAYDSKESGLVIRGSKKGIHSDFTYSDAGRGDNKIYFLDRSYFKGKYGINGNWHGFQFANMDNFAIPVLKVTRRNPGIYHPTFNPGGCARAYYGGKAVNFWEFPSSYITSVTDCFEPSKIATNYGSRISTYEKLLSRKDSSTYYKLTGTVHSGISGRPDGYYSDEIVESDVEDLRMNAVKKPDQEILRMAREDFGQNKIRGTERAIRTKFFALRSETTSGWVKSCYDRHNTNGFNSISIRPSWLFGGEGRYYGSELSRNLTGIIPGKSRIIIDHMAFMITYVSSNQIEFSPEMHNKDNNTIINFIREKIAGDGHSEYRIAIEFFDGMEYTNKRTHCSVFGDPRKLKHRVKYITKTHDNKKGDIRRGDYVKVNSNYYLSVVDRMTITIDPDTEKYSDTGKWQNLGTDGEACGITPNDRKYGIEGVLEVEDVNGRRSLLPAHNWYYDTSIINYLPLSRYDENHYSSGGNYSPVKRVVLEDHKGSKRWFTYQASWAETKKKRKNIYWVYKHDNAIAFGFNNMTQGAIALSKIQVYTKVYSDPFVQNTIFDHVKATEDVVMASSEMNRHNETHLLCKPGRNTTDHDLIVESLTTPNRYLEETRNLKGYESGYTGDLHKPINLRKSGVDHAVKFTHTLEEYYGELNLKTYYNELVYSPYDSLHDYFDTGYIRKRMAGSRYDEWITTDTYGINKSLGGYNEIIIDGKHGDNKHFIENDKDMLGREVYMEIRIDRVAASSGIGLDIADYNNKDKWNAIYDKDNKKWNGAATFPDLTPYLYKKTVVTKGNDLIFRIPLQGKIVGRIKVLHHNSEEIGVNSVKIIYRNSTDDSVIIDGKQDHKNIIRNNNIDGKKFIEIEIDDWEIGGGVSVDTADYNNENDWGKEVSFPDISQYIVFTNGRRRLVRIPFYGDYLGRLKISHDSRETIYINRVRVIKATNTPVWDFTYGSFSDDGRMKRFTGLHGFRDTNNKLALCGSKRVSLPYFTQF